MITRRCFVTRTAATAIVAASWNKPLSSSENTARSGKLSMGTYKLSNTDIVVSRIAYGCMTLGWDKGMQYDDASMARWAKEPLSVAAITEADRLIHLAYELGITFFDMADMYAFGKAEAAVGAVLKRSPGLRDKVILQSKCASRYAGDPQPGDPNRPDCSREHIISAVEGSLKRLGVDYLDILLLHRSDSLVEPQEVARAFDELKGSGKVRYFGVSNHTAMQIELLKKYVRQPLVANQVQLGLLHPYLILDGIEADREGDSRITHQYTGVAGTLDYCRLHDIQIQAWSPLRGDLLKPLVDSKPEVKQTASLLKELAAKKGTTPAAIALAWLLRHPAGIAPIVGPTNPEHLIEDCAADQVTLSREEWYTLLAAAGGVSSLTFI
jgi:predicted oxidoreductase